MTLYDIIDIKNITELSRYDTIIRKKAKLMCNNNIIYDDIVNDMYILIDAKLKEGKIINGGYVFLTMKNLLTNYYKKQNKLDFGLDYEATIPEIFDDSEDNIESKEYKETLYEELNNRISQLTWYEQKLMQYSKEMSLLELHRQSGISYRSLIYSKNKINAKIGLIKNKKDNGNNI